MTLPVGLEEWPEVEADIKVRRDADPGLLLALSIGYQAAQETTSRATEAAAMNMWRELRPVTDADKTEWVEAWNTTLGAAQERQARLTTAYVRTQFAASGVSVPEAPIDMPDSLLDDLERWALSPGRSVSASLAREADEALERIAAGRALLSDPLLADRILNLEAPVNKVRGLLADGLGLDEAVEQVAPHVGGVTYNTGRAAERIAMATGRWPSFDNGKAMVYKRVPQVGACGWCILAATRTYAMDAKIRDVGRSDDRTSSWHTGCRCSWRLLSFSEANRYFGGLGKGKDYFGAARAAGLWEGPAVTNYGDFIRRNRASADAELGVSQLSPT